MCNSSNCLTKVVFTSSLCRNILVCFRSNTFLLGVCSSEKSTKFIPSFFLNFSSKTFAYFLLRAFNDDDDTRRRTQSSRSIKNVIENNNFKAI